MFLGCVIVKIMKLNYKETESSGEHEHDHLTLRRFPPSAVSAFITSARFAISAEQACLLTFGIEIKTLVTFLNKHNSTKSKKYLKKHINLLYQIAQAAFIRDLHIVAIEDPKQAASVKVLAQLHNHLTNADNTDTTTPTALVINTTDKSTQREKEQKESAPPSPVKPLTLVG